MNLPCRKRVGKRLNTGRLQGGADPRPIIDLIIEQSDPKMYTEVYMQVGRKGGTEGRREGGRASGNGILMMFSPLYTQAFAQIYNEGLIDYDKVRPPFPPSLLPSLDSNPPWLMPSLPPSLPPALRS